MRDLMAICTELGHRDVRTYLQSGNVVFVPRTGRIARDQLDADAALADELALAIATRTGLSVPIVVRRHDELVAALAANPFDRDAPPNTRHVMFLSEEPPASAIELLDPRRSPPDEFVVIGRDVHLRLPNGSARSKLTVAWFERSLGVIATARNWNTVGALAELSVNPG